MENSSLSRSPQYGQVILINVPLSSMQIGLSALAIFVDHMAGEEAIQAQGSGGPVTGVTSDQMREGEARRGRRLEAAITPAAIEIKAIHRRLVDNRRAVHRHIDIACP